MHRGWLRSGLSIYIPTAVLAQAWRSPRQAQLAQFVSSCHDWPFDPGQARQVGELLAAAGTSDVVDGSVVVAALRLRPAAVVTRDRSDLTRLAKVARIALPIVDI